MQTQIPHLLINLSCNQNQLENVSLMFWIYYLRYIICNCSFVDVYVNGGGGDGMYEFVYIFACTDCIILCNAYVDVDCSF